jgi:hypothetical protein
MASFTIWGRVEQLDEGRFMVVASAVAPSGRRGTSTFVMTGRASDANEAQWQLRTLVSRLDARVRAGGNTVSSVDVQ